MTKIVAAPSAVAEDSAQKKPGKKKTWIVGGIVGLLAIASGAATPMFAHFGAHAAPIEADVKEKREAKTALIPFDSPVVNIKNGRYDKFLRVKIALVVDAKEESVVKEAVDKEKAFLQTWTLGYLQDFTMDQLHGSAGMNRVRREIRDEFNHRLFPEGPEKIRDVLLPEYNFQ
jgi:flagellar protein FliL